MTQFKILEVYDFVSDYCLEHNLRYVRFYISPVSNENDDFALHFYVKSVLDLDFLNDIVFYCTDYFLFTFNNLLIMLRGYKEFVAKRYPRKRKNKYLDDDFIVLNRKDFNHFVFKLCDYRNKAKALELLASELNKNIINLLKEFDNENNAQK